MTLPNLEERHAEANTTSRLRCLDSDCGGGAAANAGITLNGITLNGIALNGLTLNGITLNGVALNGPGDLAAVRPVRLTLPDGGQLTFR